MVSAIGAFWCKFHDCNNWCELIFVVAINTRHFYFSQPRLTVGRKSTTVAYPQTTTFGDRPERQKNKDNLWINPVSMLPDINGCTRSQWAALWVTCRKPSGFNLILLKLILIRLAQQLKCLQHISSRSVFWLTRYRFSFHSSHPICPYLQQSTWYKSCTLISSKCVTVLKE